MTKALFHLRQFRLLLLVLLCALFSLPLSAQEKEAYVVQSKDESTLTFYYDKSLRFRIRSGEIWGIYWGNLVPGWAGNRSFPNERTKRVVFDASFEDFRPTTTQSWFYNLSELTTIEGLENLNTSEVTDMSQMFSGCSRLTSLNLSNFNTSAVTNMNSMFEDCSSLTSLNVSNFNTSKVTNMNRMFWRCSSLTSLNLSNFNTSAVTDMSEMFSGCSRLTSLNLSNLNTSAVKYMGSMFSGCSGLTSLNLSNFNTSAITNMSAMFSGCSRLTSLNLSNFNTSAVTNMGFMFYGCSSLKELNISNFNTSKVTNMRSMFKDCSGLKTILNPNTWRCEQSQDMFKGCTQLRGAVKYDASKVDAEMANPETGYFTDSIPRAYVQQSENNETLTFYYDTNRAFRSGKTWRIDEKLGDSKPDWVGIYNSPNYIIKKVVFDASFKNFRPTTTKYWFYNLRGLTTIEELENFNTSSVTNMLGMFSDCSSLKELNVSNFNTSAVTDMSQMFSGCSGLTALNLSNFNTSAVTNMSEMFYGCSGLTSLNFSNFNTSKVAYMNGMFRDCSGLKTIINTNTWRCEQSQDMFKGCTQLKGAVKYDASDLDVTMANPTTGYFTDPNRKVEAYVLQSEDQHTLTFYYDNNRKLRSGTTWDIDKKKKKYKNIDNNSEEVPIWAGTYESSNNVVTKVVFDASFKDFRPTTTEGWVHYLSELTTIEGLENLNTSKVTNMFCMFDGCSKLTSLNLSNFNTSKVTNMEGMFRGCSRLTSLNLSNFKASKVTNMEGMFYGCSGLKELNVSNFNTSEVTNMREMFSGCYRLTSLNLSNFNTSAVVNMSVMFKNCSDPNSV